jgi:hypothetical protein
LLARLSPANTRFTYGGFMSLVKPGNNIMQALEGSTSSDVLFSRLLNRGIKKVVFVGCIFQRKSQHSSFSIVISEQATKTNAIHIELDYFYFGSF